MTPGMALLAAGFGALGGISVFVFAYLMLRAYLNREVTSA